MNVQYARLLALLLTFAFSSFAFGGPAPVNFYVSPQGNDHWSGAHPAPDAGGADGPFATLEAARDAIRALRKSGASPAREVTVYLRGGVYSRSATFDLTAEDSGTASAPIVYRAYRGDEVRITGGREVTGFAPVTDAAILNRLTPAARDHVLQVDLRAQGITDFGSLKRRGFGQPIVPAELELFFQDRPMALARYPNDEWTTIAAVPAGQNSGKFTYTGDRPKHWASLDDVWIHGYWTYDWADTYERVKSIDTAARELATVEPHGIYGYTAGHRFYFLNILEELDQPGEYYLDRKTGLLYFWPPAPLAGKRAVVSLLEKPLVAAQDCSFVTFRDLIFECTRGPAIAVNGGSHVLVAACILRNLGNNAVSMGGGTDHGVAGCDIYQTGDGGVGIWSAGDRKTLTPGRCFVSNNHFWDFSRICKTYRTAATVVGVGNRIDHNLIHDAPHMALGLAGNDNIVEFNEVHHVCMEVNDAGAFYVGRNLTMRGNIVRYNFFHHLGTGDVQGIYLDDCWCGTLVFGNVCYKAGRGVLLGGGRDNTIDNNVFIDCTPAIHVDARGMNWASFWFDGRDKFLMDGLAEVPYDKPPYSDRYPHLADILKDEPAMPKYNVLTHNIRVGGRWLDLPGVPEGIVTVTDNWTEGDPGFVDADHMNFQLRDDAPAWKIGFQRIPTEKIGLYTDEYRRKLPGAR